MPCADFVTHGRTVGRSHARMDLRTCFSGHPYTIAPKGAIKYNGESHFESKISNIFNYLGLDLEDDFFLVFESYKGDFALQK